jgi:hypothetical protein
VSSSKYPIDTLPFPHFKPEEQAALPFIIYPNWRGSQRPPLPADASDEYALHEKYSADPPIAHFPFLDFQVLQFLKGFTVPTLVAMEIQGYGGNDTETVVVKLFKVHWCGAPGNSIPRLDYEVLGGADIGKKYSVWGPLLLAIAPVQDDTVYQAPITTLTAVEPPADFVPPILAVLKKYGLPKAP